MRLLSVCIYVGILMLLVDLSYAKKKKDENDIDVSEEADAQDSDEEVDLPKKKKTVKKSSKKNSDDDENDDDSDEEGFRYACNEKDKVPLCKCDGKTLNCEKQELEDTEIYVRDNSFVAEKVNFKNNAIKALEYKGILPGMDYEPEVLDFSNNLISKIDEKSFNDFTSLKILHLSSNRLKTVSNKYLTSKVGESLHQLFLDDNQIKKISGTAFAHLVNLQKLVLDGNFGLKLSKEMFPEALSKLEILSLDGCNISKLEDNVFENLKNLKQLSLRNNPLVVIPKAINAIPNLSALDLSGTQIAELQTDTITADHNLTEIRLTNMTYLYSILDCAFCGLTNLKTVVLSNNSHLYNINENAFGGITKEKDSKYVTADLTTFDISYCNFSVLPEKLFDWTKNITLNLQGNPFNCTCDLAWLINDKNIHLNENPKCWEPAALNGTYFTKVTDFVCDGKTSASSGSSSVMWAFVLFLTVVGLVGGFLLYTRRVRVTNVLYRPEVPQMGYSNLTTDQRHPAQQHEDEEELQGEFNTRSNATLA